MANKLIRTALAALLALSGCAAPKASGKLAAYYDTRGMPTATITANASGLPVDARFFGFLDVEGDDGSGKGGGDENAGLAKAYGEFRISRNVAYGIGPAIEHDREFLKQEGVTRPGILCEPPLTGMVESAFFGIKFYPASFPDHGARIGIYGGKQWNRGDITLDFWADYNFEWGATERGGTITDGTFLSDVQLGKRLFDSVYFVVEGRYNGFNDEEPFSAGIGLEGRF